MHCFTPHTESGECAMGKRRNYRDALGYIELDAGRSAYNIQLFGPQGITRITVTRRGAVTLESGREASPAERREIERYLDAIGNPNLADVVRSQR